MDKRLNGLPENMDGRQAERFESSFADFENGASLPEEKQERILTSVMRKAGYEMKINSVIKDKEKITIANTENETGYGEVSRFGRGSLIAACIALVMAGSLGTALIFGGRMPAAEPLSQPEETAAVTETAEQETEVSAAEADVKETSAPETEPAEDPQEYWCTVPDLIGIDQQGAEFKLGEAGFIPSFHTAYDGTTEEGCVIRTDPAPSDEKLSPGTIVDVYISLGKSAKPVMIPEVMGCSEYEAIDRLVSVGLVPVIHYEYSDRNTEGIVLRTEPFGEEAYYGSDIMVYVSAGAPDPDAEIEVPNVVGLTAPQAIDLVKQYDLEYKIEYIASSVSAETVIEQSLAPLVYVNRGSVMTIYVSDGKGEPAGTAAH